MAIINDNSSVANKWGTKLIGDARVVIYDRNILIIQAKLKRIF